MLLCQVILLCLMPDNFMCQGKSKCNNQNILALDQAAQIKENIYLNLICFPTPKRLYIANNFFPLRERHYIHTTACTI
jgi:hypothetical protein